jgi:hypothetical protein
MPVWPFVYIVEAGGRVRDIDVLEKNLEPAGITLGGGA